MLPTANMQKLLSAAAYTCLLLLVPAGAAAESAVPIIDAGLPTQACSCNDQCSGADVCVETTFGYRRCCPSTMDGCPADPGEGILCRPGPGFDAGRPVHYAEGGVMDAGQGRSDGVPDPRLGGGGCSAVSSSGAPALPAIVFAFGALLFAARRTAR